MTAVRDDGSVIMELSDGTVLRGKLHEDFTVASARSLIGRTLDLDAAYRQIAISRPSSWAAVVAVWCPEDQAYKHFRQHSLPFGATSAVYGFNTQSMMLRFIGASLFVLRKHV